ncbi:ABC transporter ATP-binding protein [Labrys monachus]|uniref:Multiple sugar transport system ATP-binding protein n=1 Tax=Labrys monachus TaxID=217067 RepID=A0ABU0FBT4_9HYPH|nr:sn-glycerol-3-phosphate ABC transporter ATP-binding protein UgpC [Labrys monachus]MDQ0392079.1 multiple sugar transport system ATP-binding protein [Labrys monachus]
MSHVSLRQLVKVYGHQVAVKGIDLEIAAGSFVAFVGPSGCGKSTTLRMIAGLESVSHGEIRIGERLVNEVPARDRRIAMVFQSYALYPHMTVYENMAFALKVAKVPRADIDRRVRGAAGILQLEPYLQRRTSQLSGGQRQRVAMGRAIIREPQVFLFDEPLSNLDAQLRSAMRVEIKRLHQRLGTTAIYVTHDQTEAMTLADQIVIMRDGLIEQAGAPLDVFEQPANEFVARFVGSPAMNMLPGRIEPDAQGDPSIRLTADQAISLPPGVFGDLPAGRPVTLGVRPEDIVPQGHGVMPANGHGFSAPVVLTESLGNETLLFAQFAGQEVTSRMQQPRIVRDGETLSFSLNKNRLHLFDQETGRSLRQ